jgi:hypothetical protein
LSWKLYRKEFFLSCEMKLTVVCLFACALCGCSMHDPTPACNVTDAEKIADALRAGPHFITDDATILDWPAKKAANFEFSARAVVNGLVCRVHHLAPRMTSRDASMKFSFSGRRTALLDGLSTSIGLALPTCACFSDWHFRLVGRFVSRGI